MIGATGNIGSKIIVELLTRGHDVTGITRCPEQLQPDVKFTARRGDVNDEAGLAQLLPGHNGYQRRQIQVDGSEYFASRGRILL